MLENQNWDDTIRYIPRVFENGKEIPCQTIKENSTLNLDWRKRVVFNAKLKPMTMSRFEIKVFPEERKPLPAAEKCDFSEIFNGEAPFFEILDDTADPWGMSEKELIEMGRDPKKLRKMTEAEINKFLAIKGNLPPERIIESGKILTEYEGLYTDGTTNAILKIKKYLDRPYTDFKAVVEFSEKNKLLRVKIPVPRSFINDSAIGDGPFIVERKTKGETVFQKWVGKTNLNSQIFAVINDGVYAGKIEKEYIGITLLRGAGYCFHPIGDLPLYPEDRYLPRIDCGRYTFNFRIFTGDVTEVCKMAEIFNQPPYAVNVFPTGNRVDDLNNVYLEGKVVLTNFHFNENGEYIARIYNPSETAQPFAFYSGTLSAKGVALKGEVLSIVIKDGKASVVHDKTPV